MISKNNKTPSNSDNVIICKNVTKDYPLYSTFGQKLKGLLSNKSKIASFRALDDISLTLKKGECVGLIGLNGSGKSTLASIITGITTPSSGSVRVKGEVSMLCAASGMRTQLSGIDNIRFKCLTMGYTDKQIKGMEKEIIEFADIGMHIHQPVKTYSSGMRSRLGFAIAIHIDPDILIIDEALAVGDSSFTDKCLKKIDEFKASGKTIIFVSHGVTAMTTFCDRIIWINRGKLVGIGTPAEIVNPYCGFAREYATMSNEQQKKIMPDLKEYQKKYGIT
ncbi:MAG: ABC transporter ATP-binding protein [Clostridia bacterium]|nr:ABC transporter ATP-binding protein [Clostridia bacterium]